MDVALFQPYQGAALNMGLALICGALIGSERQVRQRMAGLRTNALVALGAACFVVFSALFDAELSPTRVGAQVVSGIGFLGAGIIFRHGFTVHGLNTAATLWCSAAVGLISGAGAYALAMMATGFVIFVNLGLRPLVKWLKRRTRAGLPTTQEYRVVLACRASDERELRQTIMTSLAATSAQVVSFESKRSDDSDLELELILSINDRSDDTINKVLSPLMITPHLLSLNWEPLTDG